jgi:hypothetical protein
MLPLILPEPIGPAAHYASQFLGYFARRGHRSAACVGWQADQVALVGPKSGGCGGVVGGVAGTLWVTGFNDAGFGSIHINTSPTAVDSPIVRGRRLRR